MSEERFLKPSDVDRSDLDGAKLYVVTERSWGRSRSWMVPAVSLAEAKRKHGYTRQLHTARDVRRARLSDRDLPVRSA